MDILSRRQISGGIGLAAAGMSLLGISPVQAATTPANSSGEIAGTNAAIHQEVSFSTTAAQIYAALTIAEQFDKVVQLSAAKHMAGMSLGSTPTQIDARPGGAFALYGGYVTGFNLELVPDTRLVQAWRAGSWAPGIYSIARFVLSQRDARTMLVFDHTGFPNEAAQHLATGWHINYWEPLAKALLAPR
jgi:activator of HSP90 ATPase